ncbi:envelope stress response membrane protein PspB [uncultured Hyphomonas sp.]|jgi:phage shock protein B|uniref:envelope stress response membrane protein PspB n=1 Tax=uncultured Hyphomonas sp. TaxID=225298 RepID=UPI002AABC79B|nr:envelope stress response membrane protein PspB [uncultured Hyphomonas sp.]
MPEEIFAITIVGIIFIGFPAIIFHYITQWRKQKTLMPDDERMMEDLWRSAKAMERRIETLERLLEAGETEEHRPPPRRSRPTFDD